MPPPASAQGTQVTLGEEMNDFIEAEGEAVTEVGTFERESNTENKDQQESREEGVDIEITDNLDNAKVNNAEGGAATSQVRTWHVLVGVDQQRSVSNTHMPKLIKCL